MKERKKSIRGLFFMLLLLVAVTSYVYADEAKIILVNTSITESAEAGKYNLYQFNLTKAGKVNLQLKHENLFNTKTYWTVELLADDLKTVLQTYDSVGTDSNKVGGSMGLSAGTYYVKVYARKECSHEYSDKPYTLNVQFVQSTDWEIEYNALAKQGNNSQATATTLKADKYSYGTIGSGSDVDFYKLTVNKAGTISIDFRHPNILKSDITWKVQLVNEKTDVIDSFDSKGTRKKHLTTQIGVTAGTYYVKITGASDSKYSDADYKIKLDFNANNKWEKEYDASNNRNNDALITANSISRGKTYSGTISNEKDVDCLKFKVPSSKYVTIKFSHVRKPVLAKWWKISLYSSNTKEIYSFYSRGTNSTLSKTLYLKKGTYYIKVSKGLKWKPLVYKISVK